MPRGQRTAWDLFYRDDRFIVYHGPLEIVATLFLLLCAVLLISAILAWHRDWLDLKRVLVGFLTYTVLLVGTLKVKGEWRAAEGAPHVGYFAVSAMVAGCVLTFVPSSGESRLLLASVASSACVGILHWLTLWFLWRVLLRMKDRFLKSGVL
jgi:hypothetical protein